MPEFAEVQNHRPAASHKKSDHQNSYNLDAVEIPFPAHRCGQSSSN